MFYGIDMDHQAMEGAFSTFCHLFDFDVSLPRTAVLGNEALWVDTPSSELDRFLQNGGHMAVYLLGWVIDPGLFCAFNSSLQVDHNLSDLGTIFVLDGEIC
jgi:hypothetical protein